MNLRNVGNLSLFLKVFLFFILLLILPIFVSYFFIKQSALSEIERSVKTNIKRIKSEIVYSNGKWNLDRYYSNRKLSSPISTNLFPVYIITNEGFIIDRSSFIKGLLDSADYHHFLQFKTPNTFNSPTSESWRIYSLPISDNSSDIGLIVVSFHNPDPEKIQGIDSKLKKNAEEINKFVFKKKGGILSKGVDTNLIDYDISYLIINKYNKILETSGRTPSFIDPSYVYEELDSGKRIVKDKATSEQFLVLSEAVNYDGKTLGVVVAGMPVSSLFFILNDYIAFSLTTRLIFTIPLTLLALYFLRKELLMLLKLPDTKKGFKSLSFDAKNSFVQIDAANIQIPYASNQYYLCKAIFSSPKKPWETDELLEKFGEDSFSGKSRKIYDAMLAVNKKAGVKLIVCKNKIFKLNPEFVSKIQTIHF